MACHKILIDYSEYVRLKSFEAKYERDIASSTKSGETQSGTGTTWQSALETPLLGTTKSITTPANATITTSLLNQNLLKKPATEKKWYFLGSPNLK